MEGVCCCKRLLLQLVLVLVAFTSFSHCTLSDEIRANEVAVRFDEIYNILDWSANQTTAFIKAVTTAVNDYCGNATTNMDACQIDSYSSSSPFLVVLSAISPEYFNGDIMITFHVRLPDSGVKADANPKYVLQKSTLITILRLPETVSAINAATDETLMVIDDERLEPIDYSLDIIMIPIVIAIFLIVTFLAICMSCLKSHKEKKKQNAMISGGKKGGEEGITLTAIKNDTGDSATTSSKNAEKQDDEVTGVDVRLTT